MRQLTLFALLFVLAGGCSKKKPTEPAEETSPQPAPAGDATAGGDTTAADRTKLLNSLRGSNQKAKRDAVEELSAWVDTDPESTAALLELLKDKTTTGLGKIHPMQINSVREAAAMTLFGAGPKGEAALKNKGFAALREGLNDPQAAIREHTAYTIGLLGPFARSLSPDVMKLCTNSDVNVHGRAFDALRAIGITDVPGFAKLLNNENRDIGKLAAELVPGIHDVPAEAVPPLTAALESEETSIRLAAAAGLATAGAKAATAADPLAAAIKKTYPAEYNPMKPYEPGNEMVYWRALSQIGAPSVTATTGLLAHTNSIVRYYAARTLGEIGPPAATAADKLKEALKDTFGNVAIEAACALCRIGEATEDAVKLVKVAMDAPGPVAQVAIEAIPRMGEAGKPLIPLALLKLGSDNPFARFAAVGLVGTLPPPEALKSAAEVGKLATDGVLPIRRRVGIVLEKLGRAGAPAAEAIGKALTSEMDDTSRDQFIDALIAMGSGAKPALPALLPLAADKSLPAQRRIRVIAAIALADPSSKDVSAALIAASGDEEASIRSAAATALGTLNPLPADAVARLVTLAKSDASNNPRVAALRAMATAGPHAKAARAEAESIAAGQQPHLALWAKVAIAAMDGDATKSATVIRAGLSDRSPTTRAAAVEALLLIAPTTTDLPILLKLLKDVGANAREAAAKCVGLLGSNAKDAVPQLTRLLSDADSNVRIAAVKALGEMGAAAMPAVEKLKELRRDPLVEPAARKALERLGVKDDGPQR